MKKFAPYPTCSPASEVWLGEVPSHWKLKPLWSLFKRVKRTDYPDEPLLSVYRDYGVIPKNSRDDNHNRASEDLSAYQLVEPGDLAINKMKAWQGSVAISDHQGIVSPAYFIFKASHEEDPRYLHYLMRSDRYISGYLSMSKGIRVNQWDLDPDKHARMPIVLPPLAEQKQISHFLDTETARIDTLIAKKTRFIELLKEKRQAVITKAVTKGLDDSVEIKDSGVEWLGMIPNHWLCKKLSYWVDKTGSGTTPSHDSDYVDTDGIPWITTGELRESTIFSTTRSVSAEAVDKFSALKIHPKGSIVIAMYGATIGRLGILGVPATMNQACCCIYPSDKIETKFLRYWFECFRGELVQLAAGGGQPNINAEKIRNLHIAAPASREEQKTVLAHIDRVCAQLESLIVKTERSIELLKEKRSALITAAVTGKIDVREAA